jgi:hypothetical protein
LLFNKLDIIYKIIQTNIDVKFTVRLFFVCLILISAFLIVKPAAFAQSLALQTTTQTQPYLAPATNPGVPNNLHTFSQSLMLEIMSSLTCNLSGKDLLSKDGRCLGYDATTGKLGYVQNNGGALGAMSGMIAILYTPPLHTADFIAYMGQNFGLAKPSYAQVTGIGFEGLTPLLNAWVVFRNVVYLLFVFIFILIGLAIMLRVRIDPRTVMTIQNQIPKIIISLILVTFSFAIAGFLIDLMWVSIYVVINLMSQADPNITASAVGTAIYHPAPQFANDVLNDTKAAISLGGIHSIAVNGASSIAQIVRDFIRPESLPPAVTAAPNSGGNGFLGTGLDIPGFIGGVIGAIGDTIGSIVSSVISWVVGILAYLILIIALLWALIRLWFALLKAYISILIDVIFAPFWIISGLIPGTQSAGFSAWIRDISGNLAAFPAAIMMFLLAKLFSDSFISGAGTSGIGSTVSNTTSGTAFIPPLLGSNASNYIASLIAVGVILATPGIVDMTKKAFKAPKLDLGPMAQGIGAAVGIGTRTGKTMMSIRQESKQPTVIGYGETTGQAIFGKRSVAEVVRGRIGLGKAPVIQAGK